MADTCARCHRPPGTALGECFRAALERDGDPAADDAYTATGADCAEATIARLQAELAEARSVDARQDVFREGFWAGRAWASAFECGGIAPDAAESWAQSDARAAAEAALGVQP